MTSFVLDPTFVDSYRSRKPPFGFNGLGELVFARTYSRIKPNGEKETWTDTVQRVINGTYSMQKNWVEANSLGWIEEAGQESAKEMFDRIYNMKFLPPGRGLWAMGSAITEERGLYAALNNCAFVSTENLDADLSKPFTFLMDASMLGIGVGFDTKGAGKVKIHQTSQEKIVKIVIHDSREGWVDAVGKVIHSYFVENSPTFEFDYSKIRQKGEKIRIFGGQASGPAPLIDLIENIRQVLTKEIGQFISVTAIVDICNMIGCCVVAGNVRRTALISFGDYQSDEFLNLKNYEKNPHRAAYGWSSNNSVFASTGMNYSVIADNIAMNGEPGLAFLENMRNYSRMCDEPDYKDHRVKGGNPCLEQSLESYELCCLVECFPTKCTDLEDFKRTLKFAYLYAKTVTLGKTHWPETNRVMLRNRRIGCSLSGIAQFITKHDLHTLKTWCEEGYQTIQHYDKIYSDYLAIPRSIKTTSIKPSGSISLCAGSTPGLHHPESRFYVRRMRVSDSSELLPKLQDAGYNIEPDKYSANTMVVEFPIDCGEGIRTVNDVSLWEQLSLAAFLNRFWADNQVSCTVTFNPKTEGKQIAHALNYFQYQLKGISFLPKLEKGAYAQMPYEEITEAQYIEMKSKLKEIDLTGKKGEDAKPELYCDGDQCTL